MVQSRIFLMFSSSVFIAFSRFSKAGLSLGIPCRKPNSACSELRLASSVFRSCGDKDMIFTAQMTPSLETLPDDLSASAARFFRGKAEVQAE